MKDDSYKLFCSSCSKDTNHNILFNYDSIANRLNEHYFHSNDILECKDPDHFQMVECMGCNHVSFAYHTLISYDNNGASYGIIQYPKSDDDEFGEKYNFLDQEPLEELPSMIQDLYFEVEEAFKSNSSILAGIGLRTLVEAICIQQKIPGRNLQNKIQNLNREGLISNSELPILDKLRLIGNVSAHEIKTINTEKLSYALDIINHVLRSIYFLPKINKKIKL